MVHPSIAWLFAATLAFTIRDVVARESKTATELFNVDFSTDDNGGCAYAGQTEIDTELEEAYNILSVGIGLVDEFDSVDEAKRLLTAFFGNPNANQRAQMKSKYQTVQNFLKNGQTFNGEKAYLFCNSNWLTRQRVADTVLDANGQRLFKNPPQNTQPLQIRDLQQRDGLTGYTYWWTSRMNAYLALPGSSPRTYCDRDARNKGVTTEPIALGRPYIPFTSITICPNGFENRWRRRNTAAVNPVKASAVTSRSQSIGSLYPTAMTLLHEIFHLVLGNSNTFVDPNTQYEEYGVAGMLQLTADQALRNPESMALVAVAYDITTATYVFGSDAIEFHTGYATQG
ncbi:hypothetical protein V8F06_006640 [Rhypophila decipiens]